MKVAVKELLYFSPTPLTFPNNKRIYVESHQDRIANVSIWVRVSRRKREAPPASTHRDFDECLLLLAVLGWVLLLPLLRLRCLLLLLLNLLLVDAAGELQLGDQVGFLKDNRGALSCLGTDVTTEKSPPHVSAFVPNLECLPHVFFLLLLFLLVIVVVRVEVHVGHLLVHVLLRLTLLLLALGLLLLFGSSYTHIQ